MRPTSTPSSWCGAARTTASSWSARRGRARLAGQGKVEGGYETDRTGRSGPAARKGSCPSAWKPYVDQGEGYVLVSFAEADCGPCPARPLCTRARRQPRRLRLHPRAEHEALTAARERLATKEGRRRYGRRAGIEGTLSRGVCAFGLRRGRYCGLARTRLQHVATAAAIDLQRLAA